MSGSSERFLCFRIGADNFAIPLLAVKQVIGMPEVTPVPQMPGHFLGIMNLRGQVVSVVDLRRRLGVKPEKSNETSVVIIDCESHHLGLVVDEVQSVLSPSADELSPAPALGESPAGRYITGVYRNGDRLILIMDVLHLLSSDEMMAMKAAG